MRSRNAPVFILALLLASGSVLALSVDYTRSASEPTVYCASPDGLPDADGSCWEDPLDLRTALNTAEPGSEVWIKQGEYRPGDDPHSAFYLPEGVDVIGGYAGTSDAPTERSGNPALTVLDGHDEHYTVLIVAAVEDATLSGVTIKNGAATLIADEATDLQRRGGGVYVSNSNVTFANTVIANNRARFGGGGIYVDEASTIELRRVTFQGNRTTHPQSGRGGGLRIREGTARLSDVTFRFNQAIRGGGMFVDNGHVQIEHSLFAENEAADRGGGMSVYSGEVDLSDTRFSHNVAVREGGGLFISRAGRRAALQGSEFRINEAGDGGGGAWIQADEVDLDRVAFLSNTGGLGSGGGVYLGNGNVRVLNTRLQGNQSFQGGGLAVQHATFEMTNGLITGNQASLPDRSIDLEAGRPAPDDPDRENMISDPWRRVITGEAFSSDYLSETLDEQADFAGGGLLFFGDGSGTLVNVTISGNGSTGPGAAVYRSGDNTLHIRNSILFHNYVSSGDDDPHANDLIYSEREAVNAHWLTVQHSLLEAGCPSHHGVFCRAVSSDDPNFLTKVPPDELPSASGDFRLWFTSPAIDAGNRAHLPSDVDRDLEGRNRFVKKRLEIEGYGDGSWLDLGPLERQIPASAANRSIAFEYHDETIEISADIETDLNGHPTGRVDVATADWAFEDFVLGRVYTEDNGGKVLIDGEAALTNGALRGFIIESDVSGTSGDIWQFRVWLDTGERTIWHSIGTE